MTDAAVLELVTSALQLGAKLAGPFLVVVLLIGVVVSLVQTVTQIQEQSLTFVPKLIACAGVAVVGGHWMIRELVSWVQQLWGTIPTLGAGG